MHPEVKAATAKGKKGDTDVAGKRKKGTGVFDIAQYIEETSSSADVVRTLLKKAMSKSYFWTEANSNPMMRSLHGSFANQAAAASYWDKLAEEKDAVVSTDACNEKRWRLRSTSPARMWISSAGRRRPSARRRKSRHRARKM